MPALLVCDRELQRLLGVHLGARLLSRRQQALGKMRLPQRQVGLDPQLAGAAHRLLQQGQGFVQGIEHHQREPQQRGRDRLPQR